MEIICVPIISAGVYALIEIYKSAIAKANSKLTQIIPAVGLILGAILGGIMFYACPNLIMANNLLNAIIIGGASGLSATGCNQLFKQLKKFGVTVEETKPTDENSDAPAPETDTPQSTPTENDPNKE